MESMKIETDAAQAEFRIVRMTPENLSSVVSLEQESGLSSRGVEAYRKSLLDTGAILLVAVDSAGLVIGSFSGTVVLDELQIDNIAISQGRRRQGIGKCLLRSALSAAKGIGARIATLEVRSSNSPARGLYASEGFVVDG